jgi:diphthamide biosynthesis protein 3
MASYDEVEIEDMEFNEETGTYFYPCPCGDMFQITLEELTEGCDIAKCPSCSLVLRVIYNIEDFQNLEEEEVDEEEQEQEIEA